MAKVNSDQLDSAIGKGLRPVYLVCGDETLLVHEACDTIRQAAIEQGFCERELHHTDVSFSWSDVLYSAQSLSLFAQKKIIEVRMHNGKPGDAGSKVIKAYCETAESETLLLLVAPKLDRNSLKSAWVTAIENCGVLVTVWPVNEKQLPRWIERRLRAKGLKVDSQALDILCTRIEGNLLAAVQEIEKLSLFATQGFIDAKLMATSVADSARYDVFTLTDRALAGQSRAAAKTLQGLRAEGCEAAVILWALAKEIRALNALKAAQAKGQRVESVSKQHGVFDSRLSFFKDALARLDRTQLELLLKECALADRAIKGLSPLNIWDILMNITLSLSAQSSLDHLAREAALQL